jgi:metal-dependent amidase/aminoacylase/carboxypeptidase family protein
VFKISITGKSGHHLNPEQCIDPILIASNFISLIEIDLKKSLGSEHHFVLGFGTIAGGAVINQTPEEVKISGTFRTFDEKDANAIETIIRRRLDFLIGLYKNKDLDGVPSYDLEILPGYPVLVNDRKFTNRSKEVLEEHFPIVNSEGELNYGAEDFAYYLEKIPGMFMLLGVKNSDNSILHINHSNRFDIDENVLITGAKVLATLCLDFLKNPNEYIGKNM